MALLVTPVGLALISAVRLLIISNYNVTTAVTVAESGGYINTFLGSLIPLVPVLMPYPPSRFWLSGGSYCARWP